ncbi:TPA: transcriptional regulator [Streptococcus agalactiae]
MPQKNALTGMDQFRNALLSEFSLPYDLIYSNNPSSSTLGFIKTIADSKLTFSID